MKTKLLTLVLVLICNTMLIYGQPGSLDNSFGNNGLVDTDFNGNIDQGNSTMIQTDDKILVGGDTSDGIDYSFALARYNYDGTLDTSFDNDGKVVTSFGQGLSFCSSMVVQTDGKIVLGGSGVTISGGSDFALVRYHADGSLDSTFDSDGIVTIDIGSNSNDIGYSMTLQPNGKIILAGQTYVNGLDFALIRINSDGSLDNSFGNNGTVTTNLGSGYADQGRSVVLQTDGKIILVGYSDLGTDNDISLVRYNADGSLDASFGSSGIVITDIDNAYNTGYAAAIQPDGKILVTGEKIGGGEMAVTLVRYNSDGSLDTTFDSNGIVITNIGNGSDEGHSVVVQQDGKLIVAGISNNGVHDDIALLRYNSNGSLDDTFDTDGIVVTDFNGNPSAASSVVIDNDNKILIAGATYNGTDLDFALARYNSGVLGANDFTNKKDYFNVFPNPTTGLLTIHSDKAISQIEIYNLLGQLVKSNTDQNSIDISSVDQGVYFVKVMDENGTIGTQKVVKK